MACRSFSAAVVLMLAVAAGRVSAEEVSGKVKSVDVDKSTVTLEVGTAERVFPVASDAKIVGSFGKNAKKATTGPIVGGLKGIKEGAEITLTTEKRDDKDVVAQVKVEGLQAKAKAKKKKKKAA